MAIVPFDPFEEIRAIQKQFLGDEWLAPHRNVAQFAATDIYTEGDKQMVVEAHLPNFDQSEVDVSLEKNVLTIRAERHEKDEDKGKNYVLRESSTSFYRRLQLPDQADESKVKADFNNGVLKIIVPFKALPKPKKVAINSGDVRKNK